MSVLYSRLAETLLWCSKLPDFFELEINDVGISRLGNCRGRIFKSQTCHSGFITFKFGSKEKVVDQRGDYGNSERKGSNLL